MTRTMAARTITLDAEAAEELDQLARNLDQPVQDVIREAVSEMALRRDRRARFLADAKRAADHYDRTGLNLTHDEVDAWLAKLEAGEDAELPPCHT